MYPPSPPSQLCTGLVLDASGPVSSDPDLSALESFRPLHFLFVFMFSSFAKKINKTTETL